MWAGVLSNAAPDRAFLAGAERGSWRISSGNIVNNNVLPTICHFFYSPVFNTLMLMMTMVSFSLEQSVGQAAGL